MNTVIKIQDPFMVEQAHQRVKPYLHETPILRSEYLDNVLGHEIYFKVESLQKTGSFKVRGALNHLLVLREKMRLPQKVVAYSTGNHAIGLAWVAKLMGIKARIYLPYNTSPIKQRTAAYFGAELIFTVSRDEAEIRSKQDEEHGYYYLHPSDHDATIAGAGTLCHEAIHQLGFAPDAIFAGCGGGGLLSGSYLAKEWLAPNALLFGTEPTVANDAVISLRQDSIHRFKDSPKTVADGLRALSVSPRTFMYLKKLNGIFTVNEHSILYWTAWLNHLLKVVCEPSSAINMQAVYEWLASVEGKTKVLVLISGGNIDPSFYRELWQEDYLLHPPLPLSASHQRAA